MVLCLDGVIYLQFIYLGIFKQLPFSAVWLPQHRLYLILNQTVVCQMCDISIYKFYFYLFICLFQLFADVVWRPAPSRHIRFKSSGALAPVLSPAELNLQYNEENSQRTLTVDFSSEDYYYSINADQSRTSLSVALSSPHNGFR